MRKFTFSVMALGMIMSCLIAIYAQTNGSLSGTVTDPAGAVVPGATVSLTNSATGAKQTATTTNAGIFNFTALQPGTYSVTVEGSGFKKTVAPNVAVEVSKQTQLTIAMQIGVAGETVTVTGAQDIVNTSTPTLTNVISTRQVQDLPIGARNPLDLAALQAGIAVIGNDTRGSSVAGLRQTATNVTQDGINSMDNFVKTSSFFALNSPSLNSTSEFSITTGTVGSDAGRGAAQVNVVTKGGSNDFHGGVFYLMRNDALNANPFFNNYNGTPKPTQHQHFFGFDVSGPVYFLGFGEGKPAIWDGHDKAFFFFSYEGFRENFQATRNRPVLTQAARNGTFQYNGTGNTGLQTVNLLTAGTGPNTLNPVVAGLLAQTPLPNNTSCAGSDGFNVGCYQFNVSGTDPNDKYVVRYDHQLVQNSHLGSHKLEFVFNRAVFLLTPDTFNVLESPFPGGQNAFQSSKRYLATGALVSNFGSSITNVFRYGRQWAPVSFLRDSSPAAPFVNFATATGITTPLSPDNTFLSQGRNTIVNEVSDNVSWATGKHLFRFGADFQKIYADTFNDAGINKTIVLGQNTANPDGLSTGSFPNSVTADVNRGRAIYQTIVGLLSSANAVFNVTSPDSGFVAGATRSRLFQEKDLALYVQDQWRMRSNFTFSYGVRWEFEGVPTIPNGLAIQPDPSTIFGISGFGNLFTPNAPAGASPGIATQNFVSGDTGKKLYKDDWDNFAPFVGIAWSPSFEKGFLHSIFGSAGKSSVRLGYSISYLHDGFTVISNALGTGTTNPGLIQTAANNTPTGVLTAGGVPLTTPTFTIPITDRQNFLVNSNNGIWAIDPNLKIPYVQQWNVGFEREIFPNTALEVRYQGNHAVKVWRTNDFNEVNIFENGFLPEFINAQRNLAICQANATSCKAAQAAAGIPATATGLPSGTVVQTANDFQNWGLAGQVPLTIFDRFFFAGTPLAIHQNYANSGSISSLQNNNIGTLASSLAFSPTFLANRNNPARGIPANFFVANPNAAFARLLTNDSSSNYHALEVEIRRRFSQGLLFQADYTFSKALDNAPAAQGNNQSDLVSFRTLRDKGLDTSRANGDQTHRFVANAVYDLPFGKGKWLLGGANGFVDKLVGGWSAGGIVTWATRPPWFVVANRTTFNSFNPATNPAQLVGISFEDFKKNVGIYRTSAGVFFINPDLLDITTSTTTGRVTTSKLKAGLIGTPAPGEFGNFPLNSLDGPTYFNLDLSVTKRLKIGERLSLELKTTLINALNHPNFTFANQTFDSTSFGVINTQSGSERIIHFTGSVRF